MKIAHAENVTNARSMALGPEGTLFVGSRTAGRVHAIIDSDNDHKADRVLMIAQRLDQPNGIAVRNGALYVATANQLLRYDEIAGMTKHSHAGTAQRRSG